MKADLSLLSLFTEASLLVQLVMMLLLLISIASWTLIFQRGFIIRQMQKSFSRFEERFRLGGDISRLYDHINSKRETPKGIERIFKAGYREFRTLAKGHVAQQDVLSGSERAMRIALAREEQHLERHLPFLATVGSISVYVGLFGTVWGIMTAFRALGVVEQATLAMVAPGISEALVATALGLFAAIPAVFAYNRYMQKAQDLTRNYDNLAEELLGLFHKRLVIQVDSEDG